MRISSKKNDSDCNFNNFSLLFPTLTNFWQSVFVCLYSMLSLLSFFYYPYCLFTPPTHEYFFCEGLIFFWCLVARGCENFEFLGDLLYWGYLVSSLGKEEWAIFFHKAINNQSCKLKNSSWKNYLLHVYLLTFHTFTWGFSL